MVVTPFLTGKEVESGNLDEEMKALYSDCVDIFNNPHAAEIYLKTLNIKQKERPQHKIFSDEELIEIKKRLNMQGINFGTRVPKLCCICSEAIEPGQNRINISLSIYGYSNRVVNKRNLCFLCEKCHNNLIKIVKSEGCE